MKMIRQTLMCTFSLAAVLALSACNKSEDSSSTTVIHPGNGVWIDGYSNIHITLAR